MIESLKKEIKFDGSKFWLGKEEIGEIDRELKFISPIDKDILDQKKLQCLGRILDV